MLCPSCRTELQMTDRQNIEIDYCPQCRGVWLDRGELDKLIERSQAAFAPARGGERDEHRRRDGEGGHDPRRHKRKSFLSELLDF